MTPKPGEVYMVDLGMAGKVRPVVIVSREDVNSPRALAVVVPLTSESRGSKYEVKMPHVPWLRLQSFANVQGIGSVEHKELVGKRAGSMRPLSGKFVMRSNGRLKSKDRPDYSKTSH